MTTTLCNTFKSPALLQQLLASAGTYNSPSSFLDHGKWSITLDDTEATKRYCRLDADMQDFRS